MLSEYDRANIHKIITEAHGDWFTAHLLRLFNKADSANQLRLGLGFPEEYEAYMAWYLGVVDEDVTTVPE